MKLRKVLCWLGIHKLDEDEWYDSYGWGEEYLHSINYCECCGKEIQKNLN